jgi:hypothetical protein
MSITIEAGLAIELIESKIRQLDDKIEQILYKWNAASIDEFIEKAKAGVLVDAIPDAVSIRNLIDKRDTLSSILTQSKEKLS